LLARKEDTGKVRIEAEVARKYFSNLVRESGEIKEGVRRVDLEGPSAGVAASL
jgi:mitofusin